jgi:hypothetical protein
MPILKLEGCVRKPSPRAAHSQALSDSSFFANLTADLGALVSSASLYGVEGTWPMPMVQYLYMFRNLSGYGYSGPLLSAFVK